MFRIQFFNRKGCKDMCENTSSIFQEDEILYEMSLETEGVASRQEQDEFEKYLKLLKK